MAVGPLRQLVAAGHDITLCVTRPDRRRGRGGGVTPSPVKVAARELGLPVSHALAEVAGAGAELGVVVAYGRIIPPELLAQVPMVNLHFSLLPRWRGAAPVERAILAGDTETGVCVMQVEEGLDTGPVYARRVVPLDETIDLATLRDELVAVGGALLVETLAHGAAGLPVPEPQRGVPTMADKLTTEDLHLRWEEGARQLHRVVRLGRAWTTFRGQRLGVLRAVPDADADPADDTADPADEAAEAAATTGRPGTLRGTSVVTGHGLLTLREVKPASRTPMSAEDWRRGVRPTEGERLGSD